MKAFIAGFAGMTLFRRRPYSRVGLRHQTTSEYSFGNKAQPAARRSGRVVSRTGGQSRSSGLPALLSRTANDAWEQERNLTSGVFHSGRRRRLWKSLKPLSFSRNNYKGVGCGPGGPPHFHVAHRDRCALKERLGGDFLVGQCRKIVWQFLRDRSTTRNSLSP